MKASVKTYSIYIFISTKLSFFKISLQFLPIVLASYWEIMK